MSTSTTGTSIISDIFFYVKNIQCPKILSCFLCFLLVRSLEATSSCESGRSAVLTLRCNPQKSTKGDLSVPRYNISVTVSLVGLLISHVTCIYAVMGCRSDGLCLAITASALQEHATAAPFISYGRAQKPVLHAQRETTIR